MNPIKHIPNSITCLNLISGSISIIYAFNGDFSSAFIMMLMAAVMDFFDGFAARLLKAYSEIGKELDSLADVISFGLAPSLILFNYLSYSETLPLWAIYIPLLIAPFSALRLAKFNLDTRQTSSFIGLPTPANGLFIGALISYAAGHNEGLNYALQNSWTLPIISVALSFALVCEVPMFSLKLKSVRWNENKSLYTFVVILVPFIVAAIITSVHITGIISFIFLMYILWNLICYPFNKK